MLSRSSAVATIGAVSISILAAPAAFAQSTSHVQQGDQVITDNIYSGNYGGCTAGYIDQESRQIHLAAHCFRGGDILYDSNFNRIGTLIASGDKDSYDAAIVQIDDGVSLGENVYSGDVVVDDSDIVIGDEICMYGHRSGYVRCDEVTQIGNRYQDHAVMTGPSMAPKQGDSGGPAWIPGKGFVGVAAHEWQSVNTGQTTAGEWIQSHPLAESIGSDLPMLGDPIPDPVPEPEPTPDPVPEPTPDPDPKPTPDPIPDDSQPEPDPKPEPITISLDDLLLLSSLSSN